MFIIKIEPHENGAHDNQNGSLSFVPEGWAMVPSNMEIPESFPFVDIEVEGNVVVSMTAREIPDISVE